MLDNLVFRVRLLLQLAAEMSVVVFYTELVLLATMLKSLRTEVWISGF